MAKGHKSDTGKRRTREHVIADLGVHHVEGHVLRAGYTMHRIVHDYGLDETIRTYNRRGEAENGLIWLQIKATDHPRRAKGDATLAVRVERPDLLNWMNELYPVIFVIYDTTRDRAFWLHVQEYVSGGTIFELARTGASVTIRVSLKQAIDQEAIRLFRELKVKAETLWKKGATPK